MNNININFQELINGRDYALEIQNIKFAKGYIVCFTGNRPVSLPWKYNEDCELFLTFKTSFSNLIKALIENGARYFITGMAMGFDMIAAEVVLELKKDYPEVKLESAIPCMNQYKGWNESYKKRYNQILERADKVTYLTDKNYFDGCFHVRNRYMVDKSDLVLACSFSSGGGTVSTIKYALSKNKNLIIVSKN